LRRLMGFSLKQSQCWLMVVVEIASSRSLLAMTEGYTSQ
jgi:hypothetical protein